LGGLDRDQHHLFPDRRIARIGHRLIGLTQGAQHGERIGHMLAPMIVDQPGGGFGIAPGIGAQPLAAQHARDAFGGGGVGNIHGNLS